MRDLTKNTCGAVGVNMSGGDINMAHHRITRHVGVKERPFIVKFAIFGIDKELYQARRKPHTTSAASTRHHWLVMHQAPYPGRTKVLFGILSLFSGL